MLFDQLAAIKIATTLAARYSSEFLTTLHAALAIHKVELRRTGLISFGVDLIENFRYIFILIAQGTTAFN